MGEFRFRGRVAWKFGDFFPGDHILGREKGHDVNREFDSFKHHVLSMFDTHFVRNFQRGNLMIAGKVFGCSRDHGSVSALKELGVSIIIAESFGRPWKMRAIINALPILECPGISTFAAKGDELGVDYDSGHINNLTTGATIQAKTPLAPQRLIIAAGSYEAYLRNRLST